MFYLYAARAARGLGDGFAAIILPTYHSELGFSLFQIGIVATAALLGSALLTLAIGLLAPYYDLPTLLLGAALMFATGAAFPNAPSGLAVCSPRASCSPEETHAAWGHVGSDQRRKRALLIIVIAIAPAAFAEFLAPNRLFVLLMRLALDSGDGFQFLRRVVPLASDRCTFIEIKLLGVIGPDQVFPGEELVSPEITFLTVHHPPMPFWRLGRGRFWRG